MKVSDIRETFSKGNIAITKTGIRVLYTNKNGWVTQSIQSNKDIIAEMSRNCVSIVFDCIRGFAVKLSFLEKIKERNTVLHQPLDTNEYNGVELSELKNNDSEFFDFFIGANLNDKDDFIGRVNDFFDYYESKRELTDEDFRKYQKDWAYFKKIITEFSKLTGCEFDEEKLEWITVYFPKGSRVSISDRAKFLFTRAIEVSDAIDIECNINEAILNITFYI